MTDWRNHPKLRERSHPDFPDDVQVVVHDGGPRVTDRIPEEIWVTVTGCNQGDVFTGRALNQPEQLRSVAQGDEIKFIASSGGHLLMVTDKYLSERQDWIIEPCGQCGLDELFDAPSDLIRIVFPNQPEGAEPVAFTAFCGLCGGVQLVQYVHADSPTVASEERPPRKWWAFWR